jgi:hypothetical protein
VDEFEQLKKEVRDLRVNVKILQIQAVVLTVGLGFAGLDLLLFR